MMSKAAIKKYRVKYEYQLEMDDAQHKNNASDDVIIFSVSIATDTRTNE